MGIEERRKAFLDNPDDYRHGTKTGYWLAPCHCEKCEAYRAEFNRQRRERAKEKWRYRYHNSSPKQRKQKVSKDVCTVDEIFKPMMGRESIIKPYCVVCGGHELLEQHHPVKRSEGKWVVDGHEIPKPTLTLCKKCHEKVHHVGGLLWFRYQTLVYEKWNQVKPPLYGAGHWEFLELSKEDEIKWRAAHPLPNGRLPSKIGYMNALEMDGWRKIL